MKKARDTSSDSIDTAVGERGDRASAYVDEGNKKDGEERMKHSMPLYNIHAEKLSSLADVACWMITGERQAARIRKMYLNALLNQEIAFFDSEINTGKVVGSLTGDTILIQDAMGEKVVISP
ncbi:ABC transporter B family member 11 [Platanthera guangdongensis]|uniref:ABC transporter B family member 11 n=1 Tax=Platanthera guangdongensis TaxID=2320717 RepID=A0ABR2MJ94_9ASPA